MRLSVSHISVGEIDIFDIFAECVPHAGGVDFTCMSGGDADVESHSWVSTFSTD